MGNQHLNIFKTEMRCEVDANKIHASQLSPIERNSLHSLANTRPPLTALRCDFTQAFKLEPGPSAIWRGNAAVQQEPSPPSGLRDATSGS
ncbi:hypothetical protein MJO28_003553 [Puccinia striiformis f. sp. tritici]|uniref:Uncharacterized protein n=1 Tax=Puccinia striiformis f. sp. tritici TaxID=168172 RepID=A0ACC0EN46_9BASI|nr:hypothetical protein MJO28_003553 [Puccinia striiformis f. sp. tritici]